jgi:hypothetical protein
MVSWFQPQNQASYDMGHTSKSSGLLRVEASWASVSQSGLKAIRGVTTGGARGTIVEVESSPS